MDPSKWGVVVRPPIVFCSSSLSPLDPHPSSGNVQPISFSNNLLVDYIDNRPTFRTTEDTIVAASWFEETNGNLPFKHSRNPPPGFSIVYDGPQDLGSERINRVNKVFFDGSSVGIMNDPRSALVRMDSVPRTYYVNTGFSEDASGVLHILWGVARYGHHIGAKLEVRDTTSGMVLDSNNTPQFYMTKNWGPQYEISHSQIEVVGTRSLSITVSLVSEEGNQDRVFIHSLWLDSASATTFRSPATISLSSVINSEASIQSVEFFVMNKSVGVTTQPNDKVVWDTVWTGDYEVTTVGTDVFGAKGVSRSVFLKVLGPSIVVRFPLTVTSPVTMAYEISSNSGHITSVELTLADGSKATLSNNVYYFGFLPTGTYSYTITATDSDGNWNTQILSFVVTPSNNLNGLSGSYYLGINFDEFLLTRVDPTVNFNWGYDAPESAVPADNWSARWNGFVTPLYSEVYRFYLNADDGVRLFIGDTQVIDHWEHTAVVETSGEIELIAGQRYLVTLEYFDSGAHAVVEWSWSSNSQIKEIVPQSQLSW